MCPNAIDITAIKPDCPWFDLLDIFDLTTISLAENLTLNVEFLLNNFLEIFNNNHRLMTAKGYPIKFVSQENLPAGEAYESFIAKTGSIPTRNNYHDFFNGLIWLNFPQTKLTFNALHAKDISEHGVTATRTSLRNALTLFDENGGVVVSSDYSLLQALQQFNWQDALYHTRGLWQADTPQAAFFPVGHALLEKLMTPRKNITSHTLLLHVAPCWFEQSLSEQRHKLDNFVAQLFAKTCVDSKIFQPLPVMGLPTYTTNNQLADFYHDKTVFRAPRAFLAPIFDY